MVYYFKSINDTLYSFADIATLVQLEIEKVLEEDDAFSIPTSIEYFCDPEFNFRAGPIEVILTFMCEEEGTFMFLIERNDGSEDVSVIGMHRRRFV